MISLWNFVPLSLLVQKLTTNCTQVTQHSSQLLWLVWVLTDVTVLLRWTTVSWTLLTTSVTLQNQTWQFFGLTNCLTHSVATVCTWATSTLLSNMKVWLLWLKTDTGKWAVSHVVYHHLTQKTKNNATTSNTSVLVLTYLKPFLLVWTVVTTMFIKTTKYLISIQSVMKFLTLTLLKLTSKNLLTGWLTLT